MRVEDGVVKPGQVLVSRTRFKELFGTDNINDINPELLKLVGYRIPTQGYNSMTNLEVVGFLDNMGDLVILPNELIVQMGHDFDVDKMYFHKLKNDDSLEDEIVKVYMEVLSNKKIFDKIIKPVDTGELADVAKDLDKIQSKNNIRTVLTPYQQTLNYFKGTLAKDGVGKTSLLSTLNALFRGKDIGLNELTLDGYIPTGIDLSNPINENGRRKAEVILEMQSATVDHIKELVADKINYNNFTHDAFSGMVMTGKDWDFIGYLLPQESIMMYVKELSLLSDNLDDNFTKDKELEALGKVVSQLRDNLDIKQDVAFEYQTPDAKDFREQLVTYYNNSEKNSNYWETQLNILNTFYKYQNIGKDLFKVQMGINTSVKGVGKNFLEINSKLDAIEDLPKIERFSNTTSLIAPETIQGKANEVLQETANIFKPLFVYNSILVNDVFKKIGELKGNKNISTRKKKEVFKFIRSFIFSKPNGLYENVDVESLKSNLLLNNTNNDSLAKRWKDYFQKNPNHFFANRLYTNVSKDPNKPSTIRFLNIGTGKRTDDYQITAELISMLENGTEIEKQLVHDTISYNFITGGNQDSGNIIKYIPIDYLNKTGFSKDIVTNFNSVQNSYSIIKQYLQHNPKDAFQLSQDKQSELKKSKDKSKTLLQLVGDSPLKFVSYFDKKWNLFEKVKGEFIQISTLGSEKITEADFTKSNSTSVFPKNNTQEVNQQLQESLKEMSNVNEEKEGKKVKEHCLNS